MFALSASHGRPERSARPSASLKRRERGLGAVELVAAAAEPEQHVGPLHVREGLGLGDRARLVQQHERRAVVADAHLRQSAPDERPNLKLRHAGRARRRRQRLEGLRGLLVVLRLVQRLRPAQGSLEPRALVGRDAARKEACIDAEPLGEPLDRLRGSGASCRARSGRRTPSRSDRRRARSASGRRRRGAAGAVHRGELPRRWLCEWRGLLSRE